MQHFRLSFILSFILMALAAWWGYSNSGTTGALHAIWIAGVLGVLEVSLSFDNAVVNATVLRNWNPFWQKLFLTVGIIVAVFGMRLLFPLLIVAFATGLGLVDVWTMALNTPDVYSAHLIGAHAQVASFGGAFLLLVFLNFLFDRHKKLHWLGRGEKLLARYGSDGLGVMLALIAVFSCVSLMPAAERYSVLVAGVVGVTIYVGVSWLSGLMEEDGDDGDAGMGLTVMRGSIAGFMYLEVLDASFSFDGVIGAFAISSDVVLIMLGLAIGAMFVRSLTVYLVNKGTLDEFVFLEHGAHYAIGLLALIMFSSVHFHVPEWFTGLSGVVLIGLSLRSSMRHKALHGVQSEG